MHLISFPLLIGILFVVALNLFFYVGTERLLYAQEEKAYEQKEDYVRLENDILANEIIYEGIDAYTMSDEVYGDEEDSALMSLASQMEGRIILLNSNFEVVADTYERNIGQYIITADTLKAMKGEEVDSKKVGDAYVQVMTGVYDRETGEERGVIISLSSLKDNSSMISFVKSQRTTISGLFPLISLVIGGLIVLLIHLPLARLRKEIQIIAAGHQEALLSEGRLREFSQIAVEFNKVIGRYKELENSRQEFVSNVSHELKTPITSMKILADSLLSMDNVPVELYDEFMHDIAHEIDRENQIINDLLDLVRLDKSAGNLNVTSANINDLLEELLKRITPIAAQRNITIHLETMRQVVAEVDVVKLSQACNNIIENAVKYNRDGGMVNVYLNADHKFFYIRVKDNGVGIPEDCQERIFERFYRVDKARSRETGGTGLGLAITRNIVLLHKGSIRVHSKEGEETTFIIRIPLNYVK